MKRLFALLGLVFAVLIDAAGNPAQAQIANINDAINKAGSLRYTANRLAKVYFQIGMGAEVDRPSEDDMSEEKLLRALMEAQGQG